MSAPARARNRMMEAAVREARRRLRDGARERNLLARISPPQRQYLESRADIVIFGGAAGGGKTFSLLADPVRHRDVKGFRALVFRRTFPEINLPGGLWEASESMYRDLGGLPSYGAKSWSWPSGASIKFTHMQREADKFNYLGAEITMIGFDQLELFTESMFFYMLNRNRSLCGVKPYLRATCNPDPDCWVAGFIAWWIDPDTGFPRYGRSGVVRWFYRAGDAIHWYGSREEAETAHPDLAAEGPPFGVTFIPAKLDDNRVLLEKDPAYRSKLMAMDRVSRGRLLDGNWKVRATAGSYFDRAEVERVDGLPGDMDAWTWVRAWDLAATEPNQENPDPSWTAGILMGYRAGDRKVLIAGLEHVRKRAGRVKSLVLDTAWSDGHTVRVTVPKDPGQAGKGQAEDFVAMLAGEGFMVAARPPGKAKEVRARPFAAHWQHGHVQVLAAPWNDEFFAEMERFPSGAHDDIVDACSDAYAELASEGRGFFDLLAEESN